MSQNIWFLIKTPLKHCTLTIFQGSSPWATLIPNSMIVVWVLYCVQLFLSRCSLRRLRFMLTKSRSRWRLSRSLCRWSLSRSSLVSWCLRSSLRSSTRCTMMILRSSLWLRWREHVLVLSPLKSLRDKPLPRHWWHSEDFLVVLQDHTLRPSLSLQGCQRDIVTLKNQFMYPC